MEAIVALIFEILSQDNGKWKQLTEKIKIVYREA